eukprot:COSAG06_NODE_36116_length_451_cov_1.318182_1_plen_22_part_01
MVPKEDATDPHRHDGVGAGRVE